MDTTSLSSEDQGVSCSQSLGAAIADAIEISGESGVLLRHTLNDFGVVATPMEEEAEDSTNEQMEKTQIPTLSHSYLMEPNDDPFEAPLSIPDDQPFDMDFFGDESMKENIPIDNLMLFKNEPILHDDMDNDFGNMDLMTDMIESGDSNEETVDNFANIPNDSSETVEVKKRERLSRMAFGSVKNTEYAEDSDGEKGPNVKKMRAESVDNNNETLHQNRESSSKGTSQSRTEKKNDLECPECEYSSKSVSTWLNHLRSIHSTTPTLAGCLLRCECGHESYGRLHSFKCEIANFTIIRNGQGPIRRVTDQPVTPRCVLCEVHPTTPCAYVVHLKRHHKTTLLANGIYLLCSCGFRHNSDRDQSKHGKECNGRDFSLHKLDENEDEVIRRVQMTPNITPQCVLCEKRPKTSCGYISHLKTQHKTTLLTNGIYLLCSCGFRHNSSTSQLKHDKKCNGRDFSLHKLNEKEHEINPKITPQCILCETYPKTPCGYTEHLKIHHKSSLKTNGIYLICSCGLRFNGHHDQKKHVKKCNGHDFTLHKIDED